VTSVFIVAASPPARTTLENLLRERRVEVAGSFASLDELSRPRGGNSARAIMVDCAGEPLDT